MNMLARKISRAKWQHKDYLAETEIRADAISGCLRTTGDTLSWWRCADKEDLAEVALALTAGQTIDRFDKIDVVMLPEAVLANAGLERSSTDGETLVKDLRKRHVDLIKLDVERLATVARILNPLIRESGNVEVFTKQRLMTLVEKAIEENRLDEADLSEKLRGQLAKNRLRDAEAPQSGSDG